MKKLYIRWEYVDWAQVRQRTFKVQQEIYSATKAKDFRGVRRYQRMILGSFDARLLAVRRVTQDNQEKSTAGVDMIKNLSSKDRLKLVYNLRIRGQKGSPLRRVWISKPGKPEKSPLGILIIKDRCLQALFKMALEPEWEAKFEPNSYGFRPGRNAHDAIAAVKACIQKRSKYVLDADIAKCFDCINQDYLLDKINMKGKYRRQLKSWLRSGVLDNEVFSETELGTPKGGVISPLLVNIALHGVETFLKDCVKNISVLGRTGKPIRAGRRAETLGVVRYANEFVIIHSELSTVLFLREKVKEFLIPIGLELSETKTRVTHTLFINKETINDCPGLGGEPGFNFLGFYIRQYATRHNSAYCINGDKLGYNTIIVPSKEERKAHQGRLHKLVLKDGKRLSQDALVKKLNAVIRSWSNYFGKSDANTCGYLTKMDYLLYQKLKRWTKRIKGTIGKGPSCFRKIGNNKWTFATEKSVMVKHIDYSFPLSKYVKVRSESSVYDHDQIYWSKRLIINNTYNTRVTILIKSQKGKCKWCNQIFLYDDDLEVEYIVPKSFEGKDEYKNLQLLHRHCRDTKTSQDGSISSS